MTEPRPDVTAIIPTQNRWRLLSRAVASALRQEDVAVEVIVVDDGSTDETPERLSRIADDRLRVIRCETPGGCLESAQSRGRRRASMLGRVSRR